MTMAPDVPAAAVATGAAGLLAGSYRRLATVCPVLGGRVRVRVPGAVPAPTALRADRGAASRAEQGVEPRAGSLREPLRARIHTADRWVGADALVCRPEALDALVDAEAARLRAGSQRTARTAAAASRVLHDYAWSVSLLMSGTWYLQRRVPRVRLGDVRVDPATGTIEVTPGPGFACLPDDLTAAQLTGVRVLAGEEALRAELRAAVADHMRPVLAAIGPRIRRGPRALWGMVTDDLISGVWHLGRALGQEERAVRAATDLLPRALPPFPGGADFRRLAGSDGRSHLTRTKLGCCLYYTVRPAEACVTCPRTCDGERVRRLES